MAAPFEVRNTYLVGASPSTRAGVAARALRTDVGSIRLQGTRRMRPVVAFGRHAEWREKRRNALLKMDERGGGQR